MKTGAEDRPIRILWIVEHIFLCILIIFLQGSVKEEGSVRNYKNWWYGMLLEWGKASFTFSLFRIHPTLGKHDTQHYQKGWIRSSMKWCCYSAPSKPVFSGFSLSFVSGEMGWWWHLFIFFVCFKVQRCKSLNG